MLRRIDVALRMRHEPEHSSARIAEPRHIGRRTVRIVRIRDTLLRTGRSEAVAAFVPRPSVPDPWPLTLSA